VRDLVAPSPGDEIAKVRARAFVALRGTLPGRKRSTRLAKFVRADQVGPELAVGQNDPLWAAPVDLLEGSVDFEGAGERVALIDRSLIDTKDARL
jgi:hypothetical protein